MDRPLIAVIMAGGTGTRLYPAARSDRPKQFRSFDAGDSLLSRTAARTDFADHVVILTRDAFADEVDNHAPGAEILVEPAPKDTGPALVYAAHQLRDRYDDAVLVCLPSDHHVGDEEAFRTALRRAALSAGDTGDLVTIGIEPSRPATEYGYVEPGTEREGVAPVTQFHEKPDEAAARRCVEAGWYWNAGIFAWTPDALLREARQGPLAPLVSALEDGDPEPFVTVEPVSVDYAVMERTDRALVVPADFPWDDLGSWDAVGRRANGPLADGLEIDASGNVIASDDAHVTAIGVSDVVIAAFDDRILVVPREEAQRVREAVSALEDEGLF